jgi:hypothetical protein
MFASLALDACRETAAPLTSNSSTCSEVTAAAAADSSTRYALLLQFALITTQLKYATGSCGSTSVVSGLFHHVMPTCRAVTALGKLIGRTAGLNSDGASSSGHTSSGSRGVEEHRERVQTMLPWIHLCGRCLFFAGGQLLMALDGPAAGLSSPGLSANAPQIMEQVSRVVFLLHVWHTDSFRLGGVTGCRAQAHV